MASPLKTPDDILNEIYAKMGLEPEPPKSMPRRAWDTVTEPIKDVLGYTQNVGAQALRGLGADESYAAAEEELRQEFGTLEGESDAKTLPGLGDVSFAALPEELKQSIVGRALKPVIKIGGNILGDPLTYLPGGQLGAIGKLGAKALPRTAATIGKITGAVPGAAKALGAGERTVRALNSPLVGAAYAPELVEGTLGGIRGAYEGIVNQDPGQFVESLVQAGISGVFATAVAKNLYENRMAPAKAAAAVKAHLLKNGRDPKEVDQTVNGLFQLDPPPGKFQDFDLQEEPFTEASPGARVPVPEQGLAFDMQSSRDAQILQLVRGGMSYDEAVNHLDNPPGSLKLQEEPFDFPKEQQPVIEPPAPKPGEPARPDELEQLTMRFVAQGFDPTLARHLAQREAAGLEGRLAETERPATTDLEELLGVEKEEGVPAPQWLTDNQQASVDTLNPSIIAKVEELSAKQLTAKQVAKALGISVDQVRAVRSKLGIPPMTSTTGVMGIPGNRNPEFDAWLKARQQPPRSEPEAPAAQPAPVRPKPPTQPPAGEAVPIPRPGAEQTAKFRANLDDLVAKSVKRIQDGEDPTAVWNQVKEQMYQNAEELGVPIDLRNEAPVILELARSLAESRGMPRFSVKNVVDAERLLTKPKAPDVPIDVGGTAPAPEGAIPGFPRGARTTIEPEVEGQSSPASQTLGKVLQAVKEPKPKVEVKPEPAPEAPVETVPVKPEAPAEQKPQEPEQASDFTPDAYTARAQRVEANPAKKAIYDRLTSEGIIEEVRKKIRQVASKHPEIDVDENDIILRAADGFDPERDAGNYRAYIYTITKNYVTSKLRLKKNQAKSVEGESPDGEASSLLDRTEAPEEGAADATIEAADKNSFRGRLFERFKSGFKRKGETHPKMGAILEKAKSAETEEDLFNAFADEFKPGINGKGQRIIQGVEYISSGRRENVNPSIIYDLLKEVSAGKSLDDAAKAIKLKYKDRPPSVFSKALSAFKSTFGELKPSSVEADFNQFLKDLGSKYGRSSVEITPVKDGFKLGPIEYTFERGAIVPKDPKVTEAAIRTLIANIFKRAAGGTKAYKQLDLPGIIKLPAKFDATNLLKEKLLEKTPEGTYAVRLPKEFAELLGESKLSKVGTWEEAAKTTNFMGLETFTKMATKLTKAGFEKAEPALSRAVELMRSGIKNGYEFGKRLVQEFGESIRAHVRDIYNWAADIVNKNLDRMEQAGARFQETNPKAARTLGVLLGGPETVSRLQGTGQGGVRVGDEKLASPVGASSLEKPENIPAGLPQPDYGYKAAEPELLKGILERPDEAPTESNPKGYVDEVVDGKVHRRQVANLPFNTKFLSGMSSDEIKDTTTTYTMLHDKLKRTKKESDRVVIREAANLFGDVSPDEFVKRVGQHGVFDTKEMRALQLLADKHFKEVTAAKEAVTDSVNNKKSTGEQEDALIRYMEAVSRSKVVGLLAADEGTRVARLLRIRGVMREALDPTITRKGTLREILHGLDFSKEATEDILDDILKGHFDDAQSKIYSQIVPNWKDKIRFLYGANLISPPGVVANAVSNTLHNYLREFDKMAAAGADWSVHKLTGKQRQFYWNGLKRAAAAHNKAYADGIPELMQDLSKILHGVELDVDFTRESPEFHKVNPFRDLKVKVKGKSIPIGEYLGNNYKLMAAMDDFQFKLSLQRELSGRAWQRAMKEAEGNVEKAERLYTDIYNDMNLARKFHDPRAWIDENGNFNEASRAKLYEKYKQYKEDIRYASKVADVDRFQAPLEGMFKDIAKIQSNYLIAAWIAPFVKTPTNIMLQTIRRTPLGIYSLLKRHKEGKFKSDLTGKQELYDEIGKLLVGNILGAGFVTMGLSGLITGGGTGDPEKDELKKAAGWQPYSVKLANGTHISYSRVEPISSIMGIAADLAEGYRQGDHETVNKLSKRLAGTLVENLTNKTFLSGLEGVFTMFSDPGRYMDRWVRQQAAGAFPNTVAGIPVGRLATSMDPNFRRTSDSLVDPIIAKIPGLSETLEPQRTPTGEERKRPGHGLWRLVSPFNITVPDSDDGGRISAELAAIDYPPSSVRRFEFIDGVKVEYTKDEIGLLQRAQEAATREAIKLLNNPNYKRLPANDLDARYGQKTRKDVMMNLYRKFKRKAMERIRPNLVARAIRNKQQRGIK